MDVFFRYFYIISFVNLLDGLYVLYQEPILLCIKLHVIFGAIRHLELIILNALSTFNH